jgi:hypothetical protein
MIPEAISGSHTQEEFYGPVEYGGVQPMFFIMTMVVSVLGWSVAEHEGSELGRIGFLAFGCFSAAVLERLERNLVQK